MKKIIFCILLINIGLHAQEEISFDLLRAPNSPAFIVLDVDEEKIQRPTSPTDFQISIKEATENFTTMPKNYSIELAPYWFFRGKNSSAHFTSNENALQGLLLSLGTTTIKDSITHIDNRKLAFGFKFSPYTGDIKKNSKLQKTLDNLTTLYSETTHKKRDKDIVYKKLDSINLNLLKEVTQIENLPQTFQDSLRVRLLLIESDKIEILLNERDEILQTQVKKDIEQEKKKVEEMEFKRYGFKMDIAGGIGLDFPSNVFDSARVNKIAIWLTTGSDFEDDLSLFFASRINIDYNKDSIGNNKSKTFVEYGLKGACDKLIKKLSISGEALGRSFLKKEDGEFKWRFLLNLSYEIFKNKLLTFNIGKEFDKKIQTGGNLIAALNLILGFGSLRPF